jgi:hypothetical protein
VRASVYQQILGEDSQDMREFICNSQLRVTQLSPGGTTDPYVRFAAPNVSNMAKIRSRSGHPVMSYSAFLDHSWQTKRETRLPHHRFFRLIRFAMRTERVMEVVAYH